MINNYLFRLLFDYRGTISRREYWAGLIFVLFSVFLSAFPFVQQRLFNSAQIAGSLSYLYYMYLDGSIQTAFYITIPFSFLSLWVCLTLTIKRCRTVSIRTPLGIIMGICTYLIFSCLKGSSLLVMYFIDISTKHSYLRSEEDLTLFTILLILFSFFILTGIISIIILSLYNLKLENKPLNRNFDSIKCLNYIGGLIAINIILFIIVSFIFGLNGSEIPIICIWIIVCILYSWIFAKRAKDAGVNVLLVIIGWLGYFILSGSIMWWVISGNLSFIMISFLCLFLGAVSFLFFISVFCLIAMPSNKTINS